MGFLDKILGKTAPAQVLPCEPGTVYGPIRGRVMPLEEIGDGVFSEGVLGPGCGIEPAEETVYAPFAGTVTQLTDTKHAIGLCSADGLELLIHVGMDTVDMNGKGFAYHVKDGEKVERGQKLMTFSFADIKAAGHPATTAVILANADEVGKPQGIKLGDAKVGDVLMRMES